VAIVATWPPLLEEFSTAPFRVSQPPHNRRMNQSMEDNGLGRFLTLADVADELAISADEVHQLVRSGELPAIRVGAKGQWRVERSEFEGYIAAKYEETRRLSLWNQADFTGVLDFDSARGGREPR